jgi:CelD/BcsL family acetyltransferase involved in cellulose biosynthesis
MIERASAIQRRFWLESGTHHLSGFASLEGALAQGLADAWRELVARDPHASLFQSPGWCIPWYQSYRDQYDPFLVVIARDGMLVGLVPMAVRLETHALVFASESMADYRDIVAIPGSRELVVTELVRSYISGRFSNVLEVGWLDPKSDTPELLMKAARAFGVHATTRHQPCWRWFPPPPAKPSAQKFLNWYNRNGTVSFEVVTSPRAWNEFKSEYYRQHSLRQIQVGRDTSFDDSRRTTFYDALFTSLDVQCHVSAFRVNGQMLAGHFGYVWRGVLLLGPPSIRLEDEQRSPAVILLAWIIQNASKLGLAGFDLTIGESDFKARLGNQRVQLTTVELHGRQRTYIARVSRRLTVGIAKTVLAAVAGEDAWKRQVKPFAARLLAARRSVAEDGIPSLLLTGIRRTTRSIYEKRTTCVYSLTKVAFQPFEAEATLAHIIHVNDNCIEDLLLLRHRSFEACTAVAACARSYSRDRGLKRSLHTVMVNGELAGWMYSHQSDGPVRLNEAPTASLEIGSRQLLLSGFYRVTGYHAYPLYEAMISHVLEQRLADGESRALLVLGSSEKQLHRVARRLGFSLLANYRCRRFLGWVASVITGPGMSVRGARA